MVHDLILPHHLVEDREEVDQAWHRLEVVQVGVEALLTVEEVHRMEAEGLLCPVLAIEV